MTVAKRRAAAVLLDAGRGDATALVEHGATVTYDQLRRRVADRQAELALPTRSLVVLVAEPSVEFVTTYLALLDGDHVPLLAGDHADRLADAWGADAVIEVAGGGLRVAGATAATERDLHPDLALLLSTSGSTGSPKLVRLSHTNLISNAAAIAAFLRLTPADRGITSLPLHYCYGLSVLHSHLLAGASLVMTSASVVDPCFADALRNHGVTNVAGVPHTFELLERAGAELIHCPSRGVVPPAAG